MKKVIFPGTFDPPTLGHLDIIRKASFIFDHVYVGVGENSRKSSTSFSLEERIELLKKVTKSMPNVEVVEFSGLLVEFAQKLGVHAIIRSVRNFTDFDYESLQSQMNRRLGDIETLFMIADEKYRFISATLVREIALRGKRLEAFIPKEIEPVVFEHLSRNVS